VTNRADQVRREPRLVVGRAGEDAAAAWYKAQGYEILARNWSCRMGELDIVARRGRLYVFSEVKARTSAAFGLPAEAVGALKQARVRRLAAFWFAAAAGDGSSRGPGGQVRFDVVSVLNGQLEVIEGAF
jgi:putative endonuclease